MRAQEQGRCEKGFTIPEVIVAGMIMIILCIGILTAYSQVVVLNRGNNIRSQALTVLQREVEAFRSFRFGPGTTDARLNAGAYPNYKTGSLSADGIPFNISVTVDNDPADTIGPALDAISNTHCRFKQIRIVAVLQNQEQGWLSALNTEVSIQRVRSN
jgi:type II secretory pathway pseudopilin PulG